MQHTTAKLFKNGQSQAIRIPKVYEFKGISEVIIRKEGDSVILSPARKSWSSFAGLPAADDDFMKSRPDLMENERVKF